MNYVRRFVGGDEPNLTTTYQRGGESKNRLMSAFN